MVQSAWQWRKLLESGHNEPGEFLEHGAVAICRRIEMKLGKADLLHCSDSIDDFLGAAHQANRRDRFGSDEAALPRGHERAVAFVNLAKARDRGQAHVLDMSDVFLPNGGEEGGDGFIPAPALVPQLPGNMQNAGDMRPGPIDHPLRAQTFARAQDASGGLKGGMKSSRQ